MGIWCLGQWKWGSILWELVERHSFWALPLLLFHCPPQLASGRFLLLFSMAHILYLILGHPAVPREELLLIQLSIPPEAAVELAHPQLFQSSTHPLDFLPLDDQAVGKALRWIPAGCPIFDQFCFGTHPISSPGSSLLCQFPDWLGQSLPFAPL